MFPQAGRTNKRQLREGRSSLGHKIYLFFFFIKANDGYWVLNSSLAETVLACYL